MSSFNFEKILQNNNKPLNLYVKSVKQGFMGPNEFGLQIRQNSCIRNFDKQLFWLNFATMIWLVVAQWREAMDLFWYEELNDFLEISLFDHDVGGKDDYMGRYHALARMTIWAGTMHCQVPMHCQGCLHGQEPRTSRYSTIHWQVPCTGRYHALAGTMHCQVPCTDRHNAKAGTMHWQG